jgi:hypothetical protein
MSKKSKAPFVFPTVTEGKQTVFELVMYVTYISNTLR